MGFVLFISFFIAQRISELLVAKKNEKWLRAQGAIEYGKSHYSFIVLLHILFISSLITEYVLRAEAHLDILFLILFFLLLSSKIWVITSLGKYWNTKIFRIPGAVPIKKGPYKLLKHPNYIIVVLEFIVVPLVFHLYFTAVVFSFLNTLMLWVRIREEEKVWATD
jgi:methyltransferase